MSGPKFDDLGSGLKKGANVSDSGEVLVFWLSELGPWKRCARSLHDPSDRAGTSNKKIPRPCGRPRARPSQQMARTLAPSRTTHQRCRLRCWRGTRSWSRTQPSSAVPARDLHIPCAPNRSQIWESSSEIGVQRSTRSNEPAHREDRLPTSPALLVGRSGPRKPDPLHREAPGRADSRPNPSVVRPTPTRCSGDLSLRTLGPFSRPPCSTRYSWRGSLALTSCKHPTIHRQRS